jgi:probable F420-dependent oxidoreductase
VKVRVGFGLGTTSSIGVDGATLRSIVDASEELGWDSIWFSERISMDVPDPIAMMAFVAGRTRRLKFGPSVLVLPGRNPVLLAKELATIDQLSGGRLVVAFGLGAPIPGDRDLVGENPREAASLVDEAVPLIERLWTEDGVTHEGPHFRVRDLSLRPRPAQRPRPDVWFGGHSGPALRRVGRIGDGWLPSFITAAEYRPKADVIREVASELGRNVDEEHYGALVTYAPGDSDVDAGPIVEAFATRRPDVDPEDVIAIKGPDDVREKLAALIEQGASKFVVVPLVAPRDWTAELALLRETVAVPLEN